MSDSRAFGGGGRGGEGVDRGAAAAFGGGGRGGEGNDRGAAAAFGGGSGGRSFAPPVQARFSAPAPAAVQPMVPPPAMVAPPPVYATRSDVAPVQAGRFSLEQYLANLPQQRAMPAPVMPQAMMPPAPQVAPVQMGIGSLLANQVPQRVLYFDAAGRPVYGGVL